MTSEAELQMRRGRTHMRIVKRKLKQGRPGRESSAPAPTFSWEKVVAASQKRKTA